MLKKYTGSTIGITGHSLGGAMANLLALEIVRKFNLISELYTFGAPRLGNISFINYFSKLISNAKRIVHNRDIVPHLPA